MTDHRQFLGALSKTQRQALTAKSNRAGFSRLAQHWVVILLLVILITLQTPLWPLFMLPLGVMLVFQFTLLHETVHHTPFATRRINEVIAYVCGFILLIPAQWFRCFHLEHHRHTHIPGKDPELASPKPQTLRAYLLHISGLPLWWGTLKVLFDNALGRNQADYIPENKRSRIKSEARLLLMGYTILLLASLLLQSTLLLFIWLLPLLLGQPFLRLYLLAEHAGCAHEKNMLVNTRTTYTNALVRWLAWNMPYHTEHHSYPAVPFFRLPELHKLLKPHLQVTEKGYSRFQREFIRGLRQPIAPETQPDKPA